MIEVLVSCNDRVRYPALIDPNDQRDGYVKPWFDLATVRRIAADITGRVRAVGDPRDIPLGALTLSAARDLLARLVRERQRADPALVHIDGRTLLTPDETSDLHDGLHPDAAACLRMGTCFAEFLESHGEASRILHRANTG